MNIPRWKANPQFGDRLSFDKEVLTYDHMGTTSLDVRLTFDTKAHDAYLVVAWHTDDGRASRLDGHRHIEWRAAVNLLGNDVAIPKELL